MPKFDIKGLFIYFFIIWVPNCFFFFLRKNNSVYFTSNKLTNTMWNMIKVLGAKHRKSRLSKIMSNSIDLSPNKPHTKVLGETKKSRAFFNNGTKFKKIYLRLVDAISNQLTISFKNNIDPCLSTTELQVKDPWTHLAHAGKDYSILWKLQQTSPGHS